MEPELKVASAELNQYGDEVLRTVLGHYYWSEEHGEISFVPNGQVMRRDLRRVNVGSRLYHVPWVRIVTTATRMSNDHVHYLAVHPDADLAQWAIVT